MTEQIFIRVLNMSLTSSVVILAVLLARLALKRASRIFSYALWAVVLFRLLCPVSFSSAFSLLGVLRTDAPVEQGGMVYIPDHIGYEMEPKVTLPVPAVSDSVNEILPPGNPAGSVNPMQIWLYLGKWIWMIGIAVMLLGGLWQLCRLRGRLSEKRPVPGEERVFETNFSTPFVLGLFRPCICIPAGLKEKEREYIVLHERLHIRRKDPLFRFLGYLALCLHWFNPLVWLAYFLSGQDMEMSCDEAVIRRMGEQVKTLYSTSLLSFSAGTHGKRKIPLAFGEGDVKSRIQNILKYKKPAALSVCALTGICAAALFLLAANPEEAAEQTTESKASAVEAEAEKEQQEPHVFYGVVSLSESSIAPLWVTIPGVGNVCIPDAEQIVPYMGTDAPQLEEGDLVKMIFDENSQIHISEASPNAFSENARRIEVLGKGLLLFQRKDGTCYLGIPLDFVPDVKASDVYLDIYHPDESGTAETLLARTCVEYMDESENLLRFALSDEDTAVFLAEYGSGIRCAGIPLRQEDLEDGIYPLIIRTLDQDSRSIDNYIWSSSGTYMSVDNGAIPLKLSEQCAYTVNRGITEPDYQEVTYEEFARIIEESDPWLNKPSDIELKGGAIVSLTMDSEWYAYGIYPVSQDQENPYADISEQVRNEQLVDVLETYYTLTQTVEADVSDAPGAERLEIYRGNLGDGESGFLLVRGADGAVLHSRFFHQARAGWGSIYLYENPESKEPLLVETHEEDRGDYGEYRYCVYRLNAQGLTRTEAGSCFEWGSSYIYREDLFEEWMSGRNRYLDFSQLLISSDEEGLYP